MHDCFIPGVEENEPMTFQIGIVTTEGVLLASDRKMVGGKVFRHSIQAPKIMVYEHLGFAHCSAGDDFCDTFTGEIAKAMEKTPTQFTNCDSLKVHRALSECLERARDKETEWRNKQGGLSGRISLPECVGGTTMLVFREEQRVTLWTVETNRPYPSPVLVDVDDEMVPKQSVIAGDPTSNAVFWLKYYFNKLPNNLDALIPIAAHAVLMAKNENIEGLQIGKFTGGFFGTLTEDELNPYRDLSEKIDSEILGRLREFQFDDKA
jgi:hypothetical protein